MGSCYPEWKYTFKENTLVRTTPKACSILVHGVLFSHFWLTYYPQIQCLITSVYPYLLQLSELIWAIVAWGLMV